MWGKRSKKIISSAFSTKDINIFYPFATINRPMKIYRFIGLFLLSGIELNLLRKEEFLILAAKALTFCVLCYIILNSDVFIY